MKGSRLFQILYCILERGTVTAPELAERLEVSVRTIYRDIDALSAAGIPVYAEAGRGGGIRLLESFDQQKSGEIGELPAAINRVLFSEEEKQIILEALGSLAALDHMDSELAKKVAALFHTEGGESWLEVDFSRWGIVPHENDTFRQLKDAILRHRETTLTYVGTRGEQTARTIRPIRLLCKAGAWYVKAYCLNREDFRIFKLSRIRSLAVTDQVFLPMQFPEEKAGREAELAEIVLRFSADAAYRVYDEFDVSQVTVQEDGTLIARARMPQDAWLSGYLLSFGTQVEVIEPAGLREVVAEQAYKIYQKNVKKT